MRRPGRDAFMTVRFTTYNLLDLFGAETAEARQHYETIAGVIRALDADVLAVQEILAPDAATAAGRLRTLADDVGMRCEVPGPAGPSGPSGSEAAVAFGGHGYHVGLMWREGSSRCPARCAATAAGTSGTAWPWSRWTWAAPGSGTVPSTPPRSARACGRIRTSAWWPRSPGPPGSRPCWWAPTGIPSARTGSRTARPGRCTSPPTPCGRRMVRRPHLPVSVGL
jgi:hypothetical protein